MPNLTDLPVELLDLTLTQLRAFEVELARRANNCPIAAGCVMSIHLPYNCPFGTVTYIFVTQSEKKA